MKMPIENPKRKEIEEYLAEIGWNLRHHGCEHYYFYNHKKKCVELSLIFPDTGDARLNLGGRNWETPNYVFYLKDIVMEVLENDGIIDCVSFRGKSNKDIFILCPNYDKKKPKLNPAHSCGDRRE